MVSVQLGTTDIVNGRTLGGQVALEKAGSRLYAIYNSGGVGSGGLIVMYSDDGGATWSTAASLASTSARLGALAYDAVNGRLEIFYAGVNDGVVGLVHRAITSNVTSGVPGAPDAAVTIDAGGTGAGAEWVSCCISPTVTNPRVWVIGGKWTSATNREVRIWWCAAGGCSTAGNWTGNVATNVGAVNSNNPVQLGRILYQKISGADRVFAVFGDPTVTPMRLKSIIFDPTTSTPGTAISGATAHPFGAIASGVFDNWENEGPLVWAASLDDYLVVGRRDPSNGNLDWFYSTDGVTFTLLTGGTFTGGRAGVTTDGTDFHIVHSNAYGASASSDQALSYRKLTKSANTVGGATAFSDGNGNGIGMPRNTGSATLDVLFRRGTASPWSIRHDSLSIVTDTTPPGAATGFAGTAVSSTEIDLVATMPTDPDVAQYTIRRLAGTTFPAADRSDGTAIVAPTEVAAGAAVSFHDTGLTPGTVYSYRLFVRDATGNWNTGVEVQVTARALPVFVQRYKADGATTIADGETPAGVSPVAEFTVAAADFSGGTVAHIRARCGSDNAKPPTQNTFDVYSGDGGSNWRYESPPGSGTFVNWPGSGLPTSEQTARKIRLYTPAGFVGQLYVSVRIEQ